MKICYLTQTAHDISDYYKDSFNGKDLYFITYKSPNPNAIEFVPKSTWSDGRNKLWDKLKDTYDYYVFIDDDLQFYNYNSVFSGSPFLAYIYYRLRLKYMNSCYQKAKPAYFLSRLEYYLDKYKPEVLSISPVNENPNSNEDVSSMKKNSFVRQLGYFDAQFTVLSNYAASKILPYDNKISGWWSSQIPVYLYAFHVFAKKAISLVDLGAVNGHWSKGGYVEDYNGIQDCKIMLEQISEATNKDYVSLAGPTEGKSVNAIYGRSEIEKANIKPTDTEDYKLNYEKNLKGLENLLHSHLVP